MATDPKQQLQSVRQRTYLGRDFDSLRATLLDYARQYYPNQIQDFSESSVGGLFLDMAAYVGDNLSFYLDHLYNELHYDTAVEADSIERALVNSGVPINGASPASTRVTIYVEVPTKNAGDEEPNPDYLPIIKEQTTFLSNNGVTFTLVENIEFAKDINSDGNYSLNPSVEKRIGNVNSNGDVTSYILALSGLAISGTTTSETFSFGNFVPFRQIYLAQPNVTEIISVTDDYGNVYYEVGALTHDVVYKNVLNTLSDNGLVKDSLKVIPAPYRFIKSVTLNNRLTTLTFGGGNADSLENDIIPDPSEFAIPTPYSKTFSRIPINPEKLLTTNTLGVSAQNTNIVVSYRYGGGLNHNVPPGSVNAIATLIVSFPKNPSVDITGKIRNTIVATNLEQATGGEDALTVAELATLIPNIKNSQERIVTKEDLLARVYTMPANLGRVFRAAIIFNPNNPLATQLYIISRDQNQKLIQSSDTLKINLKKYLNSYRMVSDAIDILDAKVINLQLKFSVVLDPALNRNALLGEIISRLQDKFNIKNLQINQPLVMSDVVNTIFTVRGVIAVDNVQFTNIVGAINNLQYSDYSHDVKSYTKNQIIFPPAGGIFEIRYPDVDIIAKVAT